MWDVYALEKDSKLRNGQYGVMRIPVTVLCVDVEYLGNERKGLPHMATEVVGWIVWITFVVWVVRRTYREDHMLQTYRRRNVQSRYEFMEDETWQPK